VTTPSTTRGQRADARRTQILSSAAQLFRRHWFTGVGIDDIGAAAGVSGPAVYRHFPSKQALLAAVIDGYMDGLEQEHEAARDQHTRLDSPLLAATVATGLRDPDGLVVYLRLMPWLDPEDFERLRARRKRLTSKWDDLLATEGNATAHPANALRMRACAGILISLAFDPSGSGPLRARAAQDMMWALLHAPLPDSARLPTPPPPRHPRVPLRHASRREAILTAATALFRERGYKGVSLRDIGAEVGITASAVNRHFESKDDLLATAFDRGAAQIAGGIAVALGRSSDAPTAVREIIVRYAQLAIDCRDLIVISATQLHSLPEGQQDQRRRHQRMYVEELRHVLAPSRPELTGDEARLRAAAVFSLVNEVVVDDELIRRPELAQELAALAVAVALPSAG
jgi:AcrR family transcriptional regulator